MKLLVTGANGFMGRALCPHLAALGHEVVPVVRRPGELLHARVLSADDEVGWHAALSGCTTVVHLAGRAHVMHDQATDPLQAFRVANVEASVALARRAVAAGVPRLVFMSTIKVNGEHTGSGECFRASDVPAPQDQYAISKWEAEQALRAFAQETGLELVIIRPPLVYGPSVKGNFSSLLRWVQRGVPLPLGAVNNQRSMVGLDNLLSLVSLCADPLKSPAAAQQVLLVSDGPALSTTELLQCIARAYHVPARLIPVPVAWMRWGARVVGRTAVAERLLGSLVVDDAPTRQRLGWQPPRTLDEQLERMRYVASA